MSSVDKLWKEITPVCPCHGDEKPVMVIQNGPHSLFYACPKYHPENRQPGERACNNRLNLIEYQKMVEKLSEELAGGESHASSSDLTNLSWKSRGVEYKVTKQKGDRLTVEIRNQKAMKS